MNRQILGIVGAVLLLDAACGGASQPVRGPSATDALRAWNEAVDRDDPRAAYALLSPAAQKQVPYEDFERRWRAHPEERRRQAHALGASLGGAAQIPERATVTLHDGQTATLVREGDVWRLESPLVSSVSAARPQDALRQFAIAVENRNFHAVMALLTSTRRDGLNQVIERFTTGLKAHVGGEIVITGDRAFIQWDDGKDKWKISLKLEDGQWRIDDIKQ